MIKAILFSSSAILFSSQVRVSMNDVDVRITSVYHSFVDNKRQIFSSCYALRYCLQISNVFKCLLLAKDIHISVMFMEMCELCFV